MSYDRARRIPIRRQLANEPRNAGLPTGKHDGKSDEFQRRHEVECSRYDRATDTERYRFARELVKRIADTRNLWSAVKKLAAQGDKAPGPNGQRLHQKLEEDEKWVWAELRRLSEQTLNGTYIPGPARQLRIPKTSGKGTRPIEVLNWQDQVVQRAIVQIVQPLVDPRLDELNFGYRPGRDRTEALANAELLLEAGSRYCVIAADLRDAFTRIPHEPLIAALNELFGNESLNRLIRRVITANGRKRGVAQGGAISALLLNLYLDRVLDKRWRELKPEIPLIRVADDILILCRDEEEALRSYTDLQKILQPTGMTLKGNTQSDLIDLGAGQTAEWLGYRISIPNGEITVQTPERFRKKLQVHLEQVMEEPDGALNVGAVLRGVVEQLGPCYLHEDRDRMIRQITAIACDVGAEETPAETELLDIWGRSHARYLAQWGLLDRLGQLRTTSCTPLVGRGSAAGHREPADSSRGSNHDTSRGPLTSQVTSTDTASVLVTVGICLPDRNGAWAFRLSPVGGRNVTDSGTSSVTRKHRMELKAVVAGLEATEQTRAVHIITMSDYVANGLVQLRDGPSNRAEQLLADISNNHDLWRQLAIAIESRRVTVQYVAESDNLRRRANGIAESNACCETSEAQPGGSGLAGAGRECETSLIPPF